MRPLLCKVCIANGADARWENWGNSGDFLKYDYLIPLNAFDLSFNVFQLECVVYDMDTFKHIFYNSIK